MSAGRARVMSRPSKATRPEKAGNRPQIVLLRVDLPAPLEPSKATISPSFKDKSIPLKTSTRPYPPRRLAISSMRDLHPSEIRLDHRGVRGDFRRRAVRDQAAVRQHPGL